jgi:hypothetical protein
MHRQLMDRRICEECGAETEVFSSRDMEPSDEETRCCRYCGFEIQVRQPDPAAVPYQPESVHAPLA